jgi:hypothetical protein
VPFNGDFTTELSAFKVYLAAKITAGLGILRKDTASLEFGTKVDMLAMLVYVGRWAISADPYPLDMRAYWISNVILSGIMSQIILVSQNF